MSAETGTPPRLGRTILQTAGTQYLGVAVGMIIAIATSRALGPEGKGAFTILQADVQLLALLLGANTSSLLYFVASRRFPVERLLGLFILVIAVGASLGFAVLTPLRSLGYARIVFPAGTESAAYLYWVLASYIVHAFSGVFAAVIQGLGEFALANRTALIAAGSDILIFGGLLLQTHMSGRTLDLEAMLTASFASAAARALLWWATFASRNRARPDFKVGDMVVPVLTFSGLSQLAEILNFFNYRLDVWFVEHFRGSAELGQYSVAVGFAQMLWILPAPIQAILFQRTAKHPTGDVETFMRMSRLTTLAVLAAAVPGFVVAGPAITLLLGRAFEPAILLFRILLVGTAFASMTKVWAGFISARGFVRYNLYVTTFGLLVTIAFDILLIPRWGGLGASVATTVCYLVISGGCLATLRWKLDIRAPGLFLTRWSDVAAVIGALAPRRGGGLPSGGREP